MAFIHILTFKKLNNYKDNISLISLNINSDVFVIFSSKPELKILTKLYSNLLSMIFFKYIFHGGGGATHISQILKQCASEKMKSKGNRYDRKGEKITKTC